MTLIYFFTSCCVGWWYPRMRVSERKRRGKQLLGQFNQCLVEIESEGWLWIQSTFKGATTFFCSFDSSTFINRFSLSSIHLLMIRPITSVSHHFTRHFWRLSSIQLFPTIFLLTFPCPNEFVRSFLKSVNDQQRPVSSHVWSTWSTVVAKSWWVLSSELAKLFHHHNYYFCLFLFNITLNLFL